MVRVGTGEADRGEEGRKKMMIMRREARGRRRSVVKTWMERTKVMIIWKDTMIIPGNVMKMGEGVTVETCKQ